LWLLIIGTIRKARGKKVRLFSLEKKKSSIYIQIKNHNQVPHLQDFYYSYLINQFGAEKFSTLHCEEHRKIHVTGKWFNTAFSSLGHRNVFLKDSVLQ